MVGIRKTLVTLVLVLVVVNSNGQTICNISYTGLMACRPSVSPPNPSPPSAACCADLSHADFKCLCSYKNSKVLPSLGIDPNLAMKLAKKCHVPHPSHC